MRPGAPRVIAHRGASAERTENTLPAFELAVEQGADMIETDLHRTRDGRVVLYHDEVLPGVGPIEAADAQAVRAVDLGGGARVPLLDEALDALGPRIGWNLELKHGASGAYPGLEEAALDAVGRRGLLPRTLFSSFYDPVLARLRELAPDARIGLLLSTRYPVDPISRALALGAEALHPELPLATPELVDAAHDAGLAVHVFTVDDPAEMERLLRMGVDGLFTNHPARMRRVLREVSPGEEGGPAGAGVHGA